MTLFTDEQMKGTGQLDMVALINKNEETKRKLRTTPHHFYGDPSHGWLKVRVSHLKVLGIFGAITGFSYRADGDVYLEEDLDAQTYINALFGKHGLRTKEQQNAFGAWRDMIINHHSNRDSFVRNLPQFHKR
jgi:hypothetical protein